MGVTVDPQALRDLPRPATPGPWIVEARYLDSWAFTNPAGTNVATVNAHRPDAMGIAALPEWVRLGLAAADTIDALRDENTENARLAALRLERLTDEVYRCEGFKQARDEARDEVARLTKEKEEERIRADSLAMERRGLAAEVARLLDALHSIEAEGADAEGPYGGKISACDRMFGIARAALKEGTT